MHRKRQTDKEQEGKKMNTIESIEQRMTNELYRLRRAEEALSESLKTKNAEIIAAACSKYIDAFSCVDDLRFCLNVKQFELMNQTKLKQSQNHR